MCSHSLFEFHFLALLGQFYESSLFPIQSYWGLRWELHYFSESSSRPNMSLWKDEKSISDRIYLLSLWIQRAFTSYKEHTDVFTGKAFQRTGYKIGGHKITCKAQPWLSSKWSIQRPLWQFVTFNWLKDLAFPLFCSFVISSRIYALAGSSWFEFALSLTTQAKTHIDSHTHSMIPFNIYSRFFLSNKFLCA